MYFQRPLALAAFCEESDGTPDVIPIVFEERFYPVVSRSQLQSTNSVEDSFAQGENIEGAGKCVASKDFLCLDLININKPALSSQDSSKRLPKVQLDGKKSIRKKLFSRSSSVKLWKKTENVLTFPLANVELIKFENKFENRKLPPTAATEYCARMNSVFGSMPNLRFAPNIPIMDQTSLDQINFELCNTFRKTDSDPLLSSSYTKSEIGKIV